VSVHDIGDLQILGCSLASGDAEALFNTNSGTIKLSSLPLVQPASPPPRHASPSAGSPDSVPPRAIQQTQTAAPEPLASLDPAAASAPVQAAAEHKYPQSAVLEALAKLGDLKAMGILTEAEFTAKKTELLGRL